MTTTLLESSVVLQIQNLPGSMIYHGIQVSCIDKDHANIFENFVDPLLVFKRQIRYNIVDLYENN